ncbi:MAG: hypothetical protein ACE5H1_02420 [Thermodesulfobacteriota bacterium]
MEKPRKIELYEIETEELLKKLGITGEIYDIEVMQRNCGLSLFVEK